MKRFHSALCLAYGSTLAAREEFFGTHTPQGGFSCCSAAIHFLSRQKRFNIIAAVRGSPGQPLAASQNSVPAGTEKIKIVNSDDMRVGIYSLREARVAAAL